MSIQRRTIGKTASDLDAFAPAMSLRKVCYDRDMIIRCRVASQS